jgi:uncharacterized membrane protein
MFKFENNNTAWMWISLLVLLFCAAGMAHCEHVSRDHPGTAPCPDRAWSVLAVGGELQDSNRCAKRLTADERNQNVEEKKRREREEYIKVQEMERRAREEKYRANHNYKTKPNLSKGNAKKK